MKNNVKINPDSQSLQTAVSDSFNLPKQTGRLMFQFDSDESQEITPIFDYGKMTIEFKQNKELDNNTTSIEFKNKEGKVFRLFIENCH